MKKIILFQILLFIGIHGCAIESKSSKIGGEVNLPNNLANKVGPSDTLYILAYPNSISSNTQKLKPESQASSETKPLVVQKIAPIIFPVKYELSQEDIIFPEEKFKGPLNIIARVHKNPESLPTQKGELEGSAKKNPVEPGSKNVDIILSIP